MSNRKSFNSSKTKSRPRLSQKGGRKSKSSYKKRMSLRGKRAVRKLKKYKSKFKKIGGGVDKAGKLGTIGRGGTGRTAIKKKNPVRKVISLPAPVPAPRTGTVIQRAATTPSNRLPPETVGGIAPLRKRLIKNTGYGPVYNRAGGPMGINVSGLRNLSAVKPVSRRTPSRTELKNSTFNAVNRTGNLLKGPQKGRPGGPARRRPPARKLRPDRANIATGTSTREGA